jgi:hypothetical protein
VIDIAHGGSIVRIEDFSRNNDLLASFVFTHS